MRVSTRCQASGLKSTWGFAFAQFSTNTGRRARLVIHIRMRDCCGSFSFILQRNGESRASGNKDVCCPPVGFNSLCCNVLANFVFSFHVHAQLCYATVKITVTLVTGNRTPLLVSPCAFLPVLVFTGVEPANHCESVQNTFSIIFFFFYFCRYAGAYEFSGD